MSDSKDAERPGKAAEIINNSGPMTAEEMAEELGFSSRPLANSALRRAVDAGILTRCPRVQDAPGRHPFEYRAPPDGEEKTVMRCRECGWTEPQRRAGDEPMCGECGVEYPAVAAEREVMVKTI